MENNNILNTYQINQTYNKIEEKILSNGSLFFELILDKNTEVFNLSLDLILNHDINLIFKIIPHPDSIIEEKNLRINIKNLTITQQNPNLKSNFNIIFENRVENPNYIFEHDLLINSIIFNEARPFICFENTYNIKNQSFYYIEQPCDIHIFQSAKNNYDNCFLITSESPVIFRKNNWIFWDDVVSNFNGLPDDNFFPIKFICSTYNINYNSYITHKIPFLYIDKSHLNLNLKNDFDSDFKFVVLNKTVLSSTYSIKNYSGHFLDLFSYSHIKNIDNFENLKTKKLTNLLFFKNTKNYEKFNLFNMFIYFLLINKLSLGKSLSAFIFLIIIGSTIFNQKDMTPADPVTTQTFLSQTMKKNYPELNIESREGWSYVDGYQQFNPLLYSIDISIPFLNLGQEKSWTPLFDEKRNWVVIYYYILKIISKYLFVFSVYKIYKKWDSDKEE